ncbi:MAG: hypothetical protein J7J20_05250, partial [Desulfurococcales archaeon]|nr:hypothetical protein [Desulfurococcales archaeon]
IGISGDGSLVAYATSSEIKVYDGDGNLLWSRSYSNMNFKAVAVSRDGDAVVAVASTIDGEYYIMYWDNIALLSGNPEPKWQTQVVGSVMRGEYGDWIAISSDGNYVIVVSVQSSVVHVNFWKNAHSLSGYVSSPDVDHTFNLGTFSNLLKVYTDISSDGSVVAYGVSYDSEVGDRLYVEVVRNADSGFSDFFTISGGTDFFSGLTLSDDGRYLTYANGSKVYFYDVETGGFKWSSADLPYPLGGGRIAAIDMSSDGEVIVAAVNIMFFSLAQVAIFNDATAKSGTNVAPNAYSNPAEVLGIDADYWDVSVDSTGRIAVVGTGNAVIAMNTATGDVMWFNTSAHPVSHTVKVSHDGAYAVTGGYVLDSVYYFSTGIASSAPQQPAQVVGGEIEVPQSPAHAVWAYLVAVTAAVAVVIALRKE